MREHGCSPRLRELELDRMKVRSKARSTATCIRRCRATPALLPYLDDYWRDQFVNRHIDRYTLHPHQLSAELAALARGRTGGRDGRARAATSTCCARRRSIAFGTRFAICNALHGAIALFNEDMAAALCARGERLGGARSCSTASRGCAPRSWCRCTIRELAVAEIERLAPDRRFVQVLLLVMGDMLLGRRHLLADLRGGREARPADRHPCRQHLPPRADRRRLAVLPGRGLRRAVGRVREPAAQPHRRRRVPEIPEAQARAASNPASPGCRRCCGAPTRPGAACAPRCRGSTGRRPRSSASMCASRCSRSMRRPTIRRALPRTLEHIGSDRMLLFSTDYPHWHFDGDDVLPDGLPDEHDAQDPDRQSARDLSAPARGGGLRR